MPKTFLFQAIQFIQTVLIQPIQFSICIVFVYTQLNIKIFLLKKKINKIKKFLFQFSVSTVSISNTILFETIQFSALKSFI